MTFKLFPARWAAAAAMLLTTNSWSGITANSSTESWTAVLYGPGNNPDAISDQQTGSFEGDIVGNANHPSLYTAFFDDGTPDIYTDGEIAFRFRVAGDKNPEGFNGCAFVGMDLDGNGSLDIFAGVNNSGSHDEVGLWWAGANAISPDSTTLARTPAISYAPTSVNYSWMVVSTANNPSGTTIDIDGAGNPDYFLSFVVPFSDFINLVKTNGFAAFNDRSIIAYVAATSTQPNSLNQDLNGVNGNVRSTLPWSSLGVVSLQVPVSGVIAASVPEPSTLALMAVGGATLAIRRRGGVSRGRKELKKRHH